MQASTEASSTVAGPFCNVPFVKLAKKVLISYEKGQKAQKGQKKRQKKCFIST